MALAALQLPLLLNSLVHYGAFKFGLVKRRAGCLLSRFGVMRDKALEESFEEGVLGMANCLLRVRSANGSVTRLLQRPH